MSAEGSLMSARRRTPTSPTTQPIAAAIPSARATLPMSRPGLRACSSAARPAFIAADKRTSEVASLKRPSPSSTVMMRWETPERFAIETATASVGDSTADTPRQGDRGNQPVNDEADREGRQEHEGDREHRNRVHLAPEVHGRHAHCGREQERRQHDLKDEMRLDLDSPHLRQEANRQADNQQNQRRCHAHLGGDKLACHDDEHSGHGDKKGIHRSIVLRATPPAPLRSHRSGYARRELARRTTPRPPAFHTGPECQTDPHEQSTFYH